MSVTGTTNILPYKVYTALLTQSGDGTSTQTTGTLIIGKRYIITTYVSGDDFTNVANVISGTINTDGCEFIAIGDTPDDYSNGSTLTDTGAPVATVLENTIGNIVWTYEGTGQYSASVPNFVQEKVLIFYGAGTAGANTYVVQAYVNNFSPFGVWIDTSDSSTGLSADDVLQETPIEIRVYN